jgi:iron(III) transport system ATP-binding protein
VAVIRDGVVVQVGTPAQVYNEPADLLTARFVGTVVELDAIEVRAGEAHTALAVVDVPGARDGATGVVVLRPEQLRLSSATEGHPANGTIVSCRYHGHDSLVRVAVDGAGAVTVRATGVVTGRPGDRVRVSVGGPGVLLPQAPDAAAIHP